MTPADRAEADAAYAKFTTDDAAWSERAGFLKGWEMGE